MSIIRAAVGGKLKEFPSNEEMETVWIFVKSELLAIDSEAGIVLMNDSGDTIGHIWDLALFNVFWETPEKMQHDLLMNNFDKE